MRLTVRRAARRRPDPAVVRVAARPESWLVDGAAAAPDIAVVLEHRPKAPSSLRRRDRATSISYRGPSLAAIALLVVLWRARFEVLDNTAALCGLIILVTVVAAVKLHPAWPHLGWSLLHPATIEAHPAAAYLFLAVSLLGAYMTPYQFEFYSSGALEQSWTGKDLALNRASAILGTIFGGLITVGLMVGAAQVLYPQHLKVQTLAIAAKPVTTAFGGTGLALFALGVFAVSAGAGLETALSGSYSICQYFGWDWGKKPRPRQVPLFHALVMFAVAVMIALTGIDPIGLTTLTMALAAVALPFTFIPLLIVANDPDYVGEQTNTRAINSVAGIILALLIVVTIAAIPLLIISGGGNASRAGRRLGSRQRAGRQRSPARTSASQFRSQSLCM